MKIQTLPIIFIYGAGMFLAGFYATAIGGLTWILFGITIFALVLSTALAATD